MAWLGQEVKLTWESSSLSPKGLIDDFHKRLSSNEMVSIQVGTTEVSVTHWLWHQTLSSKSEKVKLEEILLCLILGARMFCEYVSVCVCMYVCVLCCMYVSTHIGIVKVLILLFLFLLFLKK